MKYILLITFFGFFSIHNFSQCNPNLKKYAVGFDEIKTNSFSFLDTILNDVRIVGYGEDTHGTSEFTLLAEKLMNYLTSTHDFKILIIETGFGEGQYLNDYIQGKRDDLATILEKHNSTWRYKTKEFHQLMNWLKTYNQTHNEKIQIYGCEMQYVISDVNRIRKYLTTVNSDYVIEGFEKHLWQKIEESEKVDYFIAYTKLKKYFIDNKEKFKNKTSEKDYNLVYQHIHILGQFVTAINQNVEQRKHDFRDIYMSENIQWILNFHGKKSKALYWAHNAHVGDWVNNGIVDVAGHQLRKIYGNSYFNIATDFGVGNFLAFSRDWKMETFHYDNIIEKTFTKCLKNYGNPNTFLNFRKAKKDPTLKAYLNSKLTTMNGAGAKIRNNLTETKELGKAFDAIIYIDKTKRITWAK